MIHGHWLSRYGIAGSYTALDIAPDDFAAFMLDLPERGMAGGNVTLPHKERAAALASRLDEAAAIIGAANTLWVEEGAVLAGNTDAYGFAASLDAAAPRWASGRTATVLGAGGAARAVIHALQDRGYGDIRIVNRTRERAASLRDRFRGGCSAHAWDAVAELLADSDLLVNTTALGMKGQPTLDVDPDPLPQGAVVCDIVYVPLRTDLLARAQQRGLATADGLGMLLHQAAPGFARWFGTEPQVTEELRALIVADLERAA